MNKKLLCTAVGASLALGAGSAHALLNNNAFQQALVPYVVKDANRTTVVTVIMANGSNGTYSVGDMHLQYWTKSTTAANTAACQPSSVQIPVTPNDIITFDTAGILGYPLFGDTTNPAPLGTAISYAAPRHGYLVVQSPANFTGNPSQIYLLNSYWLELDLANGGAHGDSSNVSPNPNPGTFPVDPLLQVFPEWINGTPVNLWPSSVAATAFTVTPLGSAMVTKENNQTVLQVFNNSSPAPVQGAYDRNENGVDGTVPITVRCVGRVTPAQLMPGVAANPAWAAQGGWGVLVNLGAAGVKYGPSDPNSPDNVADVIYQIDASSAGGKFISNATRINTLPF